MKNILGILLSLTPSLITLGCSKPADYLYIHPDPHSFAITQKVREVTGSSALDIFWAVGGMTEQQANFQSGINTFMATFTQKNFSYRMAVCSSNVVERPYLGMPQVFDNTVPNASGIFVTSVMNALRGEDDEQIFDPVVFNLSSYPTFVRPGAMLVIILTNDATDSSTSTTTADQLLTFLKGLKGGDLKKVIVYGIFGASDLNCSRWQIDNDWNYHGSEFEKAIVQTNGTAYSLCDATFGTSLAKIGDDLYQRLEHPRVALDKHPDPSTIQVHFHGALLKGGDEAAGGLWYYDVSSNSVVFYNLKFAVNDTDEVTVTFVEDTGTK